MDSLFHRGFRSLADSLVAHAAETITYARGYDWVELQAVPGRQLLRLSDESGTRVEWTDLDLLVRAADLDLGCGPTLPERGDLVYRTVAYDVETYEVRPYADEPCWRYCDPAHAMIRIHLKLVDDRCD